VDSRAQLELSSINQLQHERRFHYLGHASDSAIRDVLRQVRATIFVSAEEGFGIPPFESLAAGIPVIASATLPSVNDLPEGGYLKIAPVSPATIGAAVEYLSVDANAARLWEEAGKLPIPTWRDFVSHLSDWLHF
jgi:glycosyltransferase involved in cell wall biosynthesis